MVLDIDHFKRLNDRHGHRFGDDVLRAVGVAIRKASGRRPLDLRARYGGEEMVVVWYGAAPEALPKLAEAVLDAIRAVRLVEPVGTAVVSVTASAGVTWLVPQSGDQAGAVVEAADRLMYRSKAEGRNRMRLAAFDREGAPSPGDLRTAAAA